MKARTAIRFVFGFVLLAFGASATITGLVIWAIVHYVRKGW